MKEEKTVRVMSCWVNINFVCLCVCINMLNIKVPSDLNEQCKLNTSHKIPGVFSVSDQLQFI